ncbi:hypothetical protein EUGRSUZ_F03439 [Eucalyptus grandis]|uniref:Uncharacterized protein n=2 Tax=Eucalyptus grandis TaxID=71139 RepID=A0ACC3KLC9_EUCGR|nr:hypothetical protein EUGRSUZ_F03439 [Eucalyptus grandis]
MFDGPSTNSTHQQPNHREVLIPHPPPNTKASDCWIQFQDCRIQFRHTTSPGSLFPKYMDHAAFLEIQIEN